MRFILSGITGLGLLVASCFASSESLLRSPMPLSTSPPALPAEPAPPAVSSLTGDAPMQGETANAEEPPLLDTWSLAAREDGAACRDALKAAGFAFRAYPDKGLPDKSGCGMPHAVVVFRGPTGIAYDPPIAVDCSLARALESVERIVQEEAETHLRSRIARIGNLGGFACRPRNYKKDSSLSAHAFGSAVDISAFHPVKGTPAIILRDYPEPKLPASTTTTSWAAATAASQGNRRSFLRAVFLRLRHDADLTYVVGPDFNAIHNNHFHLDRGGWHFWFNR